MTTLKLKLSPYTYKIGMNEIEGLKESIEEALEPLKKVLKDKIYWGDKVEFESAEYLRRDGFIPHSHNYGGLQFYTVIPDCEASEWPFLEFGEVTDEDLEDCSNEDEEESYRESLSSGGHLDAALNIWFKFEGLNKETNEMTFYLVASGGNNDAPYFRDLPTLYESEFKATTLEQVKAEGKKQVLKMIKKLGLK